jgi:hypothetical protein
VKLYEDNEKSPDTNNLIKNLKDFVRGNINARELEDLYDNIDVRTRNPLGSSDIIIEYKNDNQFFENVLELSDDDIWFEGIVNSPYSDYEFQDYRQVLDDFLQGYGVLDYFDVENKEKLKSISELIIPEKEFNLNDDQYRILLSKTIHELFENEIESIIEDWTYRKNDEMMKSAQEEVNKDLEGAMEKIDFEFYRKYNEISTTVANLYMWAVRLNTQSTDIKSLVKEIMEVNGSSNIGGWADVMYEYHNDEYFDDKGFNNHVDNKLDDIYDSIENDFEGKMSSINEFLAFRQRIGKKFKSDIWYKLPKEPKVQFRIEGFDKDDNRVVLLLMHPTKGTRRLSLSEENFNNLLYHLELFDRFDT